jgi:hypothetical protein
MLGEAHKEQETDRKGIEEEFADTDGRNGSGIRMDEAEAIADNEYAEEREEEADPGRGGSAWPGDGWGDEFAQECAPLLCNAAGKYCRSLIGDK